MSEEIKVGLAGRILTLTLSRTQKKNALSNDMYGALADALEKGENDPEVRVIMFEADGDSFTAGNDLKDFAATAHGSFTGPWQVTRFLRALGAATRPLVAAVQGHAVGIGTTMLLHCDLVVVAEDALLTTPFVSLALVPEAASSLLLPARIGHLRAYAMFALGESVDAAKAVEWGIANEVVPVAELRDKTRLLATKLAQQPLGALTATKRLMRDSASILARIEAENTCFAERLQSAEAREALAAFAERRPPNFAAL